jgi:hypothetical protein
VNTEAKEEWWPSTDPWSPDYCYRPRKNGLHVCGEHPDGVNCMTVANFPARSAAEAQAMFEQARSECAALPDEPHDLIVDLNRDWDCETDFPITRQALAKLQALFP